MYSKNYVHTIQRHDHQQEQRHDHQQEQSWASVDILVAYPGFIEGSWLGVMISK